MSKKTKVAFLERLGSHPFYDSVLNVETHCQLATINTCHHRLAVNHVKDPLKIAVAIVRRRQYQSIGMLFVLHYYI